MRTPNMSPDLWRIKHCAPPTLWTMKLGPGQFTRARVRRRAVGLDHEPARPTKGVQWGTMLNHSHARRGTLTSNTHTALRLTEHVARPALQAHRS